MIQRIRTTLIAVTALVNKRCVPLIVALSILPGCLRYVASKEELDKKYGKGQGGVNVAGEQEFFGYEAALKQRLDTLVAERAYLLSQSPEQNGYRLGVGDVVVVTVYGFSDLKTESTVSPTGTVSLPLVGEQMVAGIDLAEVRSTLSKSYSRYIRSPRVEVGLKTNQANRVFVVGEVARPGTYPLIRQGQILTELLSEAGGKTDKASGRLIVLPAAKESGSVGVAATNSAGVGVEIDADLLVGQLDQRPLLLPLMPGDTVVVPEAGSFQVDGEVEKGGSFKLSPRTSVMGGVAAAGGFTYSADVNKVELIREIGAGKKAVVSLDLEEIGLRGGTDVRLRDGDVIRVPSESGRFMRRQVVEVLNGAFRGIGLNGRVN